mmetsp:Transcript_31532/g.60076  ORF Transcript_31532/g.60076 Transcript_31532/m.60076 type:complete len:455 (+) Transcript_31532:141-1505(+)
MTSSSPHTDENTPVPSRNGTNSTFKIFLLLTSLAMAGLVRNKSIYINVESINGVMKTPNIENLAAISDFGAMRDELLLSDSIIPSESQNHVVKNTDVIVYLAQFGHHSSYGQQTDGVNEITGTSKLNHSLTTLYKNYVDDFPCDVIVFYSEDDSPDPELLQELKKGRPRLRFEQLEGQWWSLPPGLSMSTRRSWKLPGFSVGYRNMIRWYSKLIWPYLDALGYTHVMRMDDDSYIYSTIKYNLFEYMRDHNKRYAFRQPCTDSVGIGHLNDLMDEFLKDNPNATTPELLEHYHKDRKLGFYNNWFMADISFFLSPPGSTFLDIVDRSHIMYTQRTNDLLIQSTLARLFLQPKEIQWFQDFTYQHVTISRRKVESGCPSVGALTRGEGTDISLWRQRSDEFISRFSSACHLHATVRKDDRAFNNSAYYDCIGSKLCTMEILAFENGHYLQKIASH